MKNRGLWDFFVNSFPDHLLFLRSLEYILCVNHFTMYMYIKSRALYNLNIYNFYLPIISQ